MNYYNEFDPFAAAWLRELIKQHIIPDGLVDERSIVDVRAEELKEYTQCHFFAGIGGWSYALQIAGWDASRPVWTGSCPCQPFSSAGKQKGKSDERHLWPVWFELIKAVQPAIIFGEQVSSAIGHGWLDDVCEDLESVRFTNNRKDLYRMQDPETFDRVSEILWQVKRGRSASVQELPAGIREEVAQFIKRIQGVSAAKASREGQGVSTIVDVPQQGSLFNIGMPQKVRKEEYTIQSGQTPISYRKEDKQRVVRGEWVSTGQYSFCGKEVQHTVIGQDRPKERVHLRKCESGCLCCQCSDGGLGRGCIQTDNGKMDGEINAAKEPYITGETGNQPKTGFAHGWLDDVYQGMEAEGYAVGAAVLPACGVGAPHKRERLWFVADSSVSGWQQRNENAGGRECRIFEEQGAMLGDCSYGDVGQPNSAGSQQGQQAAATNGHWGSAFSTGGDVADTECEQTHEEQFRPKEDEGKRIADVRCGRGVDSSWSNGIWINCPDGKQRLIEPGIRLLANGIPNRVGKLRGYGNAIVPQVAAEFIKSYMEVKE